MNVLLFIPSMGSGGSERVMSILANRWASRPDVRVDLLVLGARTSFYDLDPRVGFIGLGYTGGGRRFEKAWRLLVAGFKFRRFVKAHRPDTVLCFIREANVFCLLLSRFLGLKIIVSERDSPNAPVSRFYALLRNYTYRWAYGIVVQTEAYMKFISGVVPDARIKVIANPLRPVRADDGNRRNIIVTAGRLVPEKGHSYLLKAFSLLPQSDWTLLILGDGLLRDELRQLAGDLGIADRVSLIGAVKDVDSWLGTASIFAFPSVSEGFPNALAEAMASGLPCVSFNCTAGPSDLIVDGDNGFLVDVGDVDMLAQKLAALMCSASLRLRLSENAKAVASRLDAESIACSYLDFIAED